MIFCRDCKHLQREVFCASPNNVISTVTGEPLVHFASVSRLDSTFGHCGSVAAFFEPKDPPTPKKPFWKFL